MVLLPEILLLGEKDLYHSLSNNLKAIIRVSRVPHQRNTGFSVVTESAKERGSILMADITNMNLTSQDLYLETKEGILRAERGESTPFGTYVKAKMLAKADCSLNPTDYIGRREVQHARGGPEANRTTPRGRIPSGLGLGLALLVLLV